MRFFVSTLLSFLVFLSVWQGLGGALSNSPLMSWIFTAEAKKLAAAEALKSPRILIIGGSEAHYGLSADILSRETGLPAFNLATNAGLSWKTLHLRSKEILREGDIVVFSINYSRLISSKPTSVETAYWRRRNPIEFTHFPLRQWPFFLGGDPLGDLLKAAPFAAITNWRVRVSQISPLGDETENIVTGAAFHKPKIPPLEKSQPFKADAPSLPDMLAIKGDIEALGGVFYAYFPAQLDRPEYHRRAVYRDDPRQIENLMNNAGVAMLNHMEETFLPSSLMFNTIYHPTGEGRRKISIPVARALRADLVKRDIIRGAGG